MSITEQIENDLKEAIKSQDKLKINTLRLMKTVLKIERNEEALSQEEEITRLQKAAKQRKDSAQTFQDANRNDLAENELAELEIIENYLPKMMTDEEVSEVVQSVIKEVNAESMRDIGNVMKVIMPKLKGKAEGQTIQRLVKEHLS